MANENTLPVSIVFDPSKAEAQMRDFTRTAESIFAASEARKAQQTTEGVNKAKQVKTEHQDWYKRSLGEQDQFEKMLRQAHVENLKRDLQFEKALRQAHLEDIKRMQAKAISPLTSLGLKTLDEDRDRLLKIRSVMDLVTKEFAAGNRSAEEFVQTMRKLKSLENVQLFGDSRARGEVHRFLAKTASLTFELTGAFYGLVTAMSIVGAGAIFGVKFQKDVEVAQMGMTGIITSMGLIDKAIIRVTDSWGIAGVYINKVREDSIKYGVDMSKLTEVNRSVMAPLLSAGIKLPEIQKFATAGAVAVSALGLGAQQFVQEVRDLATAGITAANSTLATSLGVTNTMVKEWKKNGTFIEEMLKRLDGFNKTSEEMLRKTLTGSWEVLKAKLGAALQDPEAFKGIIRSINAVSDAISSPAFKTGVEFYWGAIKGIASSMMNFIDVVKTLMPALTALAAVWTAMRVIEVVKTAMLATTILYGRAVTVVNALTASTITLAEAEIVQAAAARTSAAAITGVAASAVAASNSMTRAAAVGALARGLGWVGLFLWGIYEVADHFGLVDKYFTSIEDRAKKAQDAIKIMGDESLKDKLAAAGREVTRAESAKAMWAKNPYSTAADMVKADKVIADAKTIYDIYWNEWDKRANEEQKFRDMLPKVEGKLGLGDDAGKGASDAAFQSRMEQVKLEMQAKVSASDKELSNVERVELAWQKLYAEKYKHLTYSEKLKEFNEYTLGREAARLADIKEAHEKIMDTLKKEAEHYEKLGRKEPSQIEAIQADIKVREERLKSLREEISLREKLETAPTAAEKFQTLGRIEEGRMATDALAGWLPGEQGKKITAPGSVRGRSDFGVFSATGGSGITEATQTYEELRMKSEKKISFFTTQQLIEQAAAVDKSITDGRTASVRVIGLETLKIQEETAKIGLDREEQNLLDIEKARKNIEKSVGDDRLAYQEQLLALQKKNEAELAFERRKEFVAMFDGLLAPGTNIMNQLAANFGKAVNQHIQSATSNIAMKVSSGKTSEISKSDWVMTVVGIVGSLVSSGGASAAQIAKVTAAEVQKTTGTGTILGDMLAQSKSLNNSMNLLNSTAFATNKYTIQMVDSLKNVENSMKSFINVLGKSLGGDIAASMGIARSSEESSRFARYNIRVGDISHSQAGENVLGSAFRTRLNNLVWGTVTDTVTDTGLMIRGTLQQIAQGLGVTQYAAGTSKSSGVLGILGGKTSTWEREVAAPEKLAMALADVYTNMKDVFKTASESLGTSVTDVDRVFSTFQTRIGKLSLEGLNAEQKLEALNTAVSKDADLIATELFPEMLKFQAAGEGILETLSRVVVEISIMDDYFSRIGVTSKTTAENADALVTALGGVDSASRKLQDYYANFFTDAERSAHDIKILGEHFKELRLTMPATNEEFRKLVESQDLTTASGIETYAALIDISDAFNMVTKASEAATNAAREQFSLVMTAIDSLRKFGVSVRDLMDSLRRGDQAPTAMAASTLRNEFRAINALAAGGDIAAQGKLAGAATDFLTASKAQANSALEYARDFAFVQASLNTTATTTEDIVSASDKSLQAAVEANTFLADIADNTKNTKNNITALAVALGELPKSIVDAGGTVPQGMVDGLKDFNTAVTSAYGQLSSLMQQGYMQLLQVVSMKTGGMTSEMASMTPPQIALPPVTVAPTPAEIVAPVEAVQIAAIPVVDVYTASQERIAAKEAALAAFRAAEAELSFYTEMEALSGTGYHNPYIDNVRDKYTTAKNYYDSLPEFAIGSNYIERDMIAQVHAGEEITPKPYVDMQRSERSETNRLLAEFRDSFIQELRAIGLPIIQNTRDTAKILTRFDGDGLPETRVVTA